MYPPCGLERISVPSATEFYQRYMKTLTPVVLTDMFAEQAIRLINSKEKVLERWGDVPIGVEDEYGKAYNDATNLRSTPIDAANKEAALTVAQYFDYVARFPTTKKMCIEFPTPAAIASAYAIPEVCRATENDSAHFVNQCFIGNRGNVANLHFDKGGTHGFLYQVFGKKRFIVFPHHSSRKVAPFTQFSGLLLKSFSDRDRIEFLQFAGGHEVVLDAGDCMYVPSYSWHFVEYLEHSMSISLRFRRSKIVTLLANAFFPDFYLQGIACCMADVERAEMEHEAVLKEIKDALNKAYVSGIDKALHMQELAQSIYSRLYPTDCAEPYTLDLTGIMPNPLPHFLNFDDQKRPVYQ